MEDSPKSLKFDRFVLLIISTSSFLAQVGLYAQGNLHRKAQRIVSSVKGSDYVGITVGDGGKALSAADNHGLSLGV